MGAMEDEDTRIARVLQDCGQVVTPDRFEGEMASGLREQLELYRLFTYDVGCAFLADMAFNAVATCEGADFAIGINIGAPLLIARYAYCLMSDPAMFPQIGDPTREKVDPYVVGTLRTPHVPADFGRYLPRDPTRRQAAKQLSLAAYLVLFFHEINHIELGHLGFLKDRFGATHYTEIAAVPMSAAECAVRRALEWEADLAALPRSLRVWRTLHPMFDDPAIKVLTPEESWFFAAELLFWIMDFVQPTERTGALTTHPSPVVRRINLSHVTSKVDWVPTMDGGKSPLLPWIARNAFPARAFADPQYGAPTWIARELEEMRQQLVLLLPELERHRRFAGERD